MLDVGINLFLCFTIDDIHLIVNLLILLLKTGLTRRVRVHPAHTGGGIKNLFQVVRKMLKQDIRENCFNPEHGYIVDRISIEKIGDGYCLPNLGFIEYMVTFDAILLYPVVGECVDVVVEVVTDTCIIFRHACVYGVVRSYVCCFGKAARAENIL